MIRIKKLISSEIDFLNNSSYLYSSDFRVLSEDMSYRIPSMWKYENLLPWVVENKSVLVNEDAATLKYSAENNTIVVQKDEDPRVSVYKRLAKGKYVGSSDITTLWVSIPHPDADEYCAKHNLRSSYGYDEYIRFNNKVAQKEILKNQTPAWERITSKEHLDTMVQHKKGGYLKRTHGSGGFTVFHITKLDEKFYTLFDQSPKDWFYEEAVLGKSFSVQCVQDKKGDVTVFGFSEQAVEDGRFYAGSKIFPVHSLRDSIYIQITEVLKKMHEFMEGYVGFFGLDFIEDALGNVCVLEVNIRLTAVTIPTLVANGAGATTATYYEDVNKEKQQNATTVLAVDNDGVADTLHF